jgi:molecular chaperone DnaK
MTIAVGIDLGTTNSSIAYMDEYGRPIVIPNDIGSPITPSVVYFKDDEIIVGQDAKDMLGAGDPDATAFFKRQMGVRNSPIRKKGKDYFPADLSSFILKKLKKDAETKLGTAIRDAVITVPAYFRNPQREDTIVAGQLAGLNVLQVINEPTAAAIAYGFHHISENKTLLVYDLGGGTFDVTILKILNSEIQVVTSDGDYELGGKDWDVHIVEYIANKFKEEHGDDPLDDAGNIGDLLVRAEDVKKRLSSLESTSMTMIHRGIRARYEISRKDFEIVTANLMERTINLTNKALSDAKMKACDLDGVLLIGGSTRMPAVRNFIIDRLGKPPLPGVNVDEAVALGAARVAAEYGDHNLIREGRFSIGGSISFRDVTNHSLGMIALNSDRTAYINSVILPKNESIPCKQNRPYQHRVRRTGYSVLEVFLTQGEGESPADVGYLGKYIVTDIPACDEGFQVLEIEYHYNLSGTVEVGAIIQRTGQNLTVMVEPLPSDIPGRFLVSPEDIISSQHTTVYLAFDLSGSMSGNPIHEAQKAAKSFLSNMDITQSSIGVIAVADRTKITLEASQNAKKIEQAIDAIVDVNVGAGNRADPFNDILNLFSQKDGRKYAIVLADGKWNNPDRAIEGAKACHAMGIDIIGIGFGGADEKFLRAISSSDESSFFVGLDKLVETFSTIAQVMTESAGLDGRPSGFLRRL